MNRSQLQRRDRSRGNRAPFAVLFAVTLLCLTPVVGHAEYLLGDAKMSGQVGEKRDGFLALIDQRAPEKVKKMVIDTNTRRRARYVDLSQRLGLTVEAAGKAAAQRNFQNAQKGELLETETGGWKRKEHAPPKPKVKRQVQRKGRIPGR